MTAFPKTNFELDVRRITSHFFSFRIMFETWHLLFAFYGQPTTMESTQ